MSNLKKVNQDIKPLNFDIIEVNMDEHIKIMNKQEPFFKKIKKVDLLKFLKIILAMSPLSLLFIPSLSSSIAIKIVAFLISSSFGIKFIFEGANIDKKPNNKKPKDYSEDYADCETFDEMFEQTNKDLSKIRGLDDIYTEEFKEELETAEEEKAFHNFSNKKKVINIEKYFPGKKSIDINSVHDKKAEIINISDYINKQVNITNKEDVMVYAVKCIDVYSFAYKIPPITISNKEWELLFDEIYLTFQNKDILDHYFDAMIAILRRTLARGLVRKSSEINIESFFNELNLLKSYGLSDREILNINKNILLKLQNKSKIINVNFRRK